MTDQIPRDRHPEEIEENIEDVTLIWLDDSITDSPDSKHTQMLLLQVTNFVQFYTNACLCIDYIRTVKNEKIFLIVRDLLVHEVLPKIHSLATVNSVFILCSHSSGPQQYLSTYSKVKGIFDEPKALIESIQNSIHLISKHLIVFSIFNQRNQKSIRNLSKESASFIWNQLLIDTLKNMPLTNDAKNDMLDKCADYYRTNKVELERIELFRNSYTSDKAIEWYTRDSFVYRLVNKALRTEDIDLLYLFRFYIIDLCAQLQRESKRNIFETDTVTLYRGQQMSTEEFNKLKANIGVLISINGFFSSSRDLGIAQSFVAGTKNTNELKTLLFEIKIHSSLKKIIFADIDKYSQMTGEQEVLFSVGSVFKIDNIQLEPDLDLWKIHMTATDDGSNNVEDYISSMREEIEYISPTILFGALLFNEMGQIDKAEKYFHVLMEKSPKDHEDVPDLYDQLANIYTEQEKLDMALQNYINAYEIRRSKFSSDDVRVANSLHNLGMIHTKKGEYNKAMAYYKQVLAIDEKNYPNGHANKAHTMICIGKVYDANREYDLALDYMIKACEIYRTLLPNQHPYISSTLWNIGSVYENKLDYDRALEYYHSGFVMDEKILPSDHPDFNKNLDRVARVYMKKEECIHGINYFQERLTTQINVLGEIHPRIAHIMMKIGDISGDLFERLNRYEQALTIFEAYIPPDHLSMISCLQEISAMYQKQKLFQKVIYYLTKTLLIQEKLMSKNHLNMGCTLQRIGETYLEIKSYSEALLFLKRSIAIYEANYSQPNDAILKMKRDICLIEEAIKPENREC